MPSSRNFLCLVFPLISFPLPSAATSRKSSFLPSFTSSRSTGFEWRAVRPAANARPISRGLRRSATCPPNRSGRPPVGWIQRFGEFDSTTRHLFAGVAAGGRRKRSKLTRDVARHSSRNQVHELLGVAAGGCHDESGQANRIQDARVRLRHGPLSRSGDQPGSHLRGRKRDRL